jgi:hypothetical protein
MQAWRQWGERGSPLLRNAVLDQLELPNGILGPMSQMCQTGGPLMIWMESLESN